MYKQLIRPVLFLLDPEYVHNLTFKLLKFARQIPGMKYILRSFFCIKSKELQREVFGITFKNPVGIAAGLDKNGEYYNDLANFGFSFVEIGSITPKPQLGNPRKRIFRLPADNAIINRMGINNKGTKFVINQLRNNPNIIPVGASLSKNTLTPNEKASDDYEKSLTMLYDYVDFFVLNVSCPNVKDLTELQDISILSEIIDRVMAIRRFNESQKPVLLKVSPDIPISQLDEILELALVSGIEGIVATNTTRNHNGLITPKEKVDAIGDGGLSGAPLFPKSLAFVRHIYKKTNGIIPIIAAGGIMTPEQAKEMLDAGASLIEVYTGFIYNGPFFARKIIKYLKKCSKSQQLPSVPSETKS